MTRNNIISEIDLGYKRIADVIRYSHHAIAKKILKKLYYKSIDIDYTKGINSYFDKLIVIMYYESKNMEAIILIKNRLLVNKKKNDNKVLARLHYFLGSILIELSDYNSSIHYLKKSLELTINSTPISLESLTLTFLSLSNNYVRKNNLDKAVNYNELGLSYFTDKKTIEDYYYFYLYLIFDQIFILFIKQKFIEVKKIFETIDINNPAVGIKEKAIIDRIEMQIILINNNYDSQEFIKKCISLINIIKHLDDEELEIEVFALLKKHYSNKGDYENALKYSNIILGKLNKQPKQVSILQATSIEKKNKSNFNDDFIIFKKKELSQAAKYQTNFFKNIFRSSKLNVNTTYNSAKTISGDYLGSFNLDKEGNHYLFVLADAVCEGLTGTYISFMLDGIIKSIIYNADNFNLKKIINDINSILTESLNSQGFVSLWAGIIDVNNNSLESVNAGYIPTYLLSKDNSIKNLKKGCTILGMFNELPEFESETLEFKKGDSLLAFSEGVKKTINYSEKDFNVVINNLITKYSVDRTVNFDKFLSKKIENYKNFCQVEDDISSLVINY